MAEGDVRLAALLEESLAAAGWQVDVVHDGSSAFALLLSEVGIDVALLDSMLPGMDAVSVTRRLHELGLTTPLLMLTTRDEASDGLAAFDADADDYLAKPFDLDELLARLRALHRRPRQ